MTKRRKLQKRVHVKSQTTSGLKTVAVLAKSVEILGNSKRKNVWSSWNAHHHSQCFLLAPFHGARVPGSHSRDQIYVWWNLWCSYFEILPRLPQSKFGHIQVGLQQGRRVPDHLHPRPFASPQRQGQVLQTGAGRPSLRVEEHRPRSQSAFTRVLSSGTRSSRFLPRPTGDTRQSQTIRHPDGAKRDLSSLRRRNARKRSNSWNKNRWCTMMNNVWCTMMNSLYTIFKQFHFHSNNYSIEKVLTWRATIFFATVIRRLLRRASSRGFHSYRS